MSLRPSTTRIKVLHYLSVNGTATNSEIAFGLDTNDHTIYGHLVLLLEHKLITVCKLPNTRSRTFKLTGGGVKFLNEHMPSPPTAEAVPTLSTRSESAVDAVASVVTENEQLRSLLSELRDKIDHALGGA